MSQKPPPIKTKLRRWNGPKCGFDCQPNIISGRCPLSWANQSTSGQVDCSQPERKKMVNGNPYISVKRATTKALNAPKLRQSRFVCGLKKLKAKMMNTAELINTSSQSP